MNNDRKTSRGRKIARRTFLAAAGVVGGGLLVGAGAIAWRLNTIDGYRLPAGEGEASFGAWLRFARDGKIEVVVPHQDMGQGIYALAALLAAEGLKVAPEAVRAVPAPVEPLYANPVLLLDGLPIDDAVPSASHSATLWTFEKILRAIGLQATGGSSSTRHIAQPIRLASASALDMLVRAAAARFGVSTDALTIASGSIAAPDGRRVSYGELADAASKLAPQEIAVPPLANGALVGKGAPRFDVLPKAEGLARYGIDTREAGQLYAAIRHSPRIGGRLARATLASGTSGVRGIVQGKDYVAVVADTYAQAMAGLDRVDATWNDSKALKISTPDVFAAYRAALDKGVDYKPRWVVDSEGDVAKAAGKTVKATYDAPFLAHATMEPMNATALVADSGVTVWAGHQSASLVRMLAAGAAGVSGDKVTVMTPWLGGGFGRRFDLNYVVKAVEIAGQFKGKPVQTIWSRAEDIRDDVFRPAAMADVSATLGADNIPTGFTYRIASPSVTDQWIVRTFPFAKGGLMADRTTVDGALFPFYGLGSRSIENFTADTGIPVGYWRSVGFSLNCFFVESFIDELAIAANTPPLDYRAKLLAAAGDHAPARRAAELLARMQRYDQSSPLAPAAGGAKAGRGFALTECFHSFVGQVADVEVSGDNIRVRKVHAVVDCGFAIDPPNVAAQVRSAINFGLSAALFGKVDFDNGGVVPTNFDGYPVLTLDNAPEISVEIVNSGAPLGGVGEIGTPAIAPAVANAIFAAIGIRLRSLPLTLAHS